MDRLTDFLAMGGYAVFVWPAFALTAVVMIGLLVSTLRRLRANERMLAQMQAAAPRRDRRGPRPAPSDARTREKAPAQ
jgi:heme exporter protein D